MNILAIDPGKHGGICFFSDVLTPQLFSIPKVADEIDIRALVHILEHPLLFTQDTELLTDTLVIIENVHALFGSSATATFSFGHVCGMLEGIINTIGYRYVKVSPKDWQKEMFQGIDPIFKPKKSEKGRGSLETKKMAELACKRLFPNVDVYLTDNGTKSKKVHDGLVDALLLAEYGRRKFS